ncbi:hypothetical protein C0993_008760 [Termitomyces sp. T159_Od127]|nr:hypothetical protein C0993_008760 [Termitomyces sp. T159_Od127]
MPSIQLLNAPGPPESAQMPSHSLYEAEESNFGIPLSAKVKFKALPLLLLPTTMPSIQLPNAARPLESTQMPSSSLYEAEESYFTIAVADIEFEALLLLPHHHALHPAPKLAMHPP